MRNWAAKANSKEGRLFAQTAVSVALIYGVFWNSHEAPDLRGFLFPWLAHIRSAGPIHAFSEPFSNYSPPYLYLLSAASLLSLSPLSTVKLLSVLGSLLLGFAAYRLMRAAHPSKAVEAGCLTLLLPTVILNGPFLGQCDALWVACCLLAVAAAIDDRPFGMTAWAAVAFAIKAQAIFIAPFVAAIIVRERKWAAVLIPFGIYAIAIAPAWIIGWPLGDLLTIYAKQYSYAELLSLAPNLWALPYVLIQPAPHILFLLGYAATGVAVIIYLWRFPRNLLIAALLSSLLIPWLMPKMHERYFVLADVLALMLAISDRRCIIVLILVQAGSLFSFGAYASNMPPLNVVGSAFMTVGLLAVLRASGRESEADANHEEPRSTGDSPSKFLDLARERSSPARVTEP